VNSGCFITLEGTEGAGKSTAAAAIADWIRDRGIELLVTREPGGTELGEKLRALLLVPAIDAPVPKAELLMMFAARVQHIERVIQPALDQGKWVLCDRFTDASFAYQGGGRGLGMQSIEVIEQWAHCDLQPDLTLLFDLPVDQGLKRAALRSGPDRFEQEKLDFFTAVRDAYHQRMGRHPARIKRVDASRNEADVLSQAKLLLEPLFVD
jgi:dTMP kinase